MSTEEGACQTHCQGLHPTGKAAHVKLVTCANTTVCEPPCVPYSFDYDQCVKAEVMGECKPAFDACNVSSDCVAYQGCASKCTKLADCLGCAMVPGGDMGEKLYEASQLCVEKKCIAEGWLPSF